MLDPIVEETRKARQSYLEECGNTIQGLYKDLKQKEQTSGRTYYILQPQTLDQMICGGQDRRDLDESPQLPTPPLTNNDKPQNHPSK